MGPGPRCPGHRGSEPRAQAPCAPPRGARAQGSPAGNPTAIRTNQKPSLPAQNTHVPRPGPRRPPGAETQPRGPQSTCAQALPPAPRMQTQPGNTRARARARARARISIVSCADGSSTSMFGLTVLRDASHPCRAWRRAATRELDNPVRSREDQKTQQQSREQGGAAHAARCCKLPRARALPPRAPAKPLRLPRARSAQRRLHRHMRHCARVTQFCWSPQ